MAERRQTSGGPLPLATSEEAARAAFNHGYVLACCNIANLHDQPEIAFDILRELGVTRAQVRAMNLCDYDRQALRHIERARGDCSVYVSPPVQGPSREKRLTRKRATAGFL